MQVDRQQRSLWRGIGLHGERHRHRHGQVVLLVVQVDLLAEIAALSPLANDDDPRIVEHRSPRQRTIRTQQTDAVEPGEVVALPGRQVFEQRDHALSVDGADGF